MEFTKRQQRRKFPRPLYVAWAALGFLGCFAGARAFAASQTLSPSDDTFINSGNPDNNNGGSASIFTGTDGHGGIMRGLIRFGMPAVLTGRVTVTNAQLDMTTQALGSGAAGAAATESLHPVSAPWAQGNGVGSTSGTFTVGELCGGLITGATWNKPDCTTSTSWGSVAAATATATSPATSGAVVTWNSAGMSADVQGWIDTPGSNHGWLITSSTEGMAAQVQRFASTEAGANVPSLAITYSCLPGFFDAGSTCTTCSAAANANCAVSQGNSCVDAGPPSTTFTCACTGVAYAPATGGDGNPACVPVTLDIDGNGAYDALTDGLMIIRYLFGLTGPQVSNGAIGSGATRATSAGVAQFLDGLRPRLDVDGNTHVDALTDGLLVLRYLFGLRGTSLAAGAIGTGATRSGPQIESYIQSLMP